MLQLMRWLSRGRVSCGEQVKVNYRVSRLEFVAWWAGMLLLHCIAFSYYVAVAKLYNSFRTGFTARAIQTLSIGIDNSQYPKVSAIHATIAAIHATYILLMVVSSIHARKLVFQPDLRLLFRAMTRDPRSAWFINRFVGSQQRPALAPAGSDVAANSDRLSSARYVSQRVFGTIGRSHSFIFARDGLLGVDSVYFDHVLLLRELVETGLQTYQVYRMSQVLPRLWLIRFYVALLAANCWAVPLLHRYYRNRETTRRILCLLCDAVLDMVSSIGISLIIFSHYALEYNDPQFGFPYTNWLDHKWLATMQQEFQMMLVVSWGDMMSRLVFALGLLQCMDAIKEMLTPVANRPTATLVASRLDKLPTASSMVALTPSPRVVAHESSVAASDIHNDEGTAKVGRKAIKSDGGPATETVSAATRATTDSAFTVKVLSDLSSKGTRLQRFVYFVVHVLGPGAFVLWGCVILAIHLVAETHTSNAACDLLLKPWFSRKPGCAIIEINCHNIQSTGQDEAIASALEAYDPERAARVVFRHCPALIMSPKIQQFKNIVTFKVYNSTVVSWDDASALTGTHHKSMQALYLVRTFFPTGELPPGLVTGDFPPHIADVTTSVTNLGNLPSNLDKKWTHVVRLALEFSQLTTVPSVLLRLRLDLVSFVGSPLISVPAELFEMPSLRGVYLGLTHIQELPRNVARVSSRLTSVLLQQTNVTTFWSWMDHFVDVQMLYSQNLFNAVNTPFCRELKQIAAGNLSDFSVPRSSDLAKVMDVSTPEKLSYVRRAVQCEPSAKGLTSYFPLAFEDAMHRLR